MTTSELPRVLSTSDKPELPKSCASSPAILPYWPVWAAAQFTSGDEATGLLQFVHVWAKDDCVQIESTDGHRAFRYRLPRCSSDGAPSLWRVAENGLLLHGASLKKSTARAKLLTVTHDMKAIFHGGKGDMLNEISSIDLSGREGIYDISDCSKAEAYPSIDRLWPDYPSSEVYGTWGFNARYLREWCAVVEKLSTNNISRTKGMSPRAPFIFSATYQPRIGQHFEEPQLELLLMPVQIRDFS